MSRKKMTMDGNQAAAYVAYAYSEVAAIYPITPSTTMAEVVDEWASEGKENIFGERVCVREMQSEAGMAGTMHGSLAAGALATTFTASQGLLLMIPNLYKMAGELLPAVVHVSARAVASHALSIFGDHSDIYACRQTGVAMLATSSVQEVMDLSPVAHMAAVKGRIPFLHFFDGFRTSHEIQKIDVWDYERLKELLDMADVWEFRKHALHPCHPKEMGSAQNPDIFFQAKEASNRYYDALPTIVENSMRKINMEIGSNYQLFQYYGAIDATQVIIAMGSVCSTIEEVVDYLHNKEEKVGMIQVHLYRPFSRKHLLESLPESVEKITVLDRTKEPGAIGEPLYLDVVAALRDTKFHHVPIYSGRYGLGSKDTTPTQIDSVFHNVGKKKFTIGIVDDVTHLSLHRSEELRLKNEGTISCKFWGLGGDGTVGANKNSIKIIGEHTEQYVQAYFEYDSKKSGGLTVSHLRFGNRPIRSSYLIEQADFVACHNDTYLGKYDMVQEVKPGGTFLLNTTFAGKKLEEKLPLEVKYYIAKNNIQLYTIDGMGIGKIIGLNSKINTVLQSAFFALSRIIPVEDAKGYMKEAADKTYRAKGNKIVQMNFDAIDQGSIGIVKIPVPERWGIPSEDKCYGTQYKNLDAKLKKDNEQFVETIQKAINAHKGNDLPVSSFLPYVNGETPSGTSAFERRNVAVDVPVWNPEYCVQCNRCAFVCPHGVIRPVAMKKEELEHMPEGMKTIPMAGIDGYAYGIIISNVDCTGCGACASVCPGKKLNPDLSMDKGNEENKALIMCPAKDHVEKQQYFDYGKAIPIKKEVVDYFKKSTVKGSQFQKPLLEFSGACAGCGETPYAKLITQLYGDRIYIANATGCSSIWGNSSPSTPYTVNEDGKGPAWSNSLFEDAAEFGYGMFLAQNVIREKLKRKVEALVGFLEEQVESTEARESIRKLRESAEEWLHTFHEGNKNGEAAEAFVQQLENGTLCYEKSVAEILREKEFLSKKSQWIFGGDGWAYDIGFGGLDHVLASGENLNVLVFDTEVYSNTGGQSSKATPLGATAKFEQCGKRRKKKDLAAMAMSYGMVYVAQIALGADYQQTIKAITEAESYQGSSLIIAYAPCISHGIKSGMGSAPAEQKKAVESGYYHLFRYHPKGGEDGKGKFNLDSKDPKDSYLEFLKGENRYDTLKRTRPEQARKLFGEAAEDAKKRLEYLKGLEKRLSE